LRWSFTPAIWRSDLWPNATKDAASGSKIGPDCKLFHDARNHAVSWRQDAKIFVLDADDFDGSYLSLALEIPEIHRQSISKNSILSVETNASAPDDFGASLRLNLQRGPNIYENWHPLNPQQGSTITDFDMANFGIDPAQAQSAWLDFMVLPRRSFTLSVNSLSISHRQRLEF
jgi:hypothetical protein